jgi:hypothetical protein
MQAGGQPSTLETGSRLPNASAARRLRRTRPLRCCPRRHTRTRRLLTMCTGRHLHTTTLPRLIRPRITSRPLALTRPRLDTPSMPMAVCPPVDMPRTPRREAARRTRPRHTGQSATRLTAHLRTRLRRMHRYRHRCRTRRHQDSTVAGRRHPIEPTASSSLLHPPCGLGRPARTKARWALPMDSHAQRSCVRAIPALSTRLAKTGCANARRHVFVKVVALGLARVKARSQASQHRIHDTGGLHQASYAYGEGEIRGRLDCNALVFCYRSDAVDGYS